MDSRTPKNMQELLMFAIKQQQNEETECIQIDEDKKEFLHHVLQSMSVNVIEEFLKSIRILQGEHSSDEKIYEALDAIYDNVIDIDFANSFVKLEGADILINCVKNPNKTVCTHAMRIIAEMSQNNPICQQYFLEHKAIELLMKYISSEDLEIAGNAVYALSALIRNYEPALTEFINKDGPTKINECFSSKSPVFMKSCFLVTSISSEYQLLKDEFAKLGTCKLLAKRLQISHDMHEKELCINAISVLIESRYCNLDENEKKCILDISNFIKSNNDYLPEDEVVCSCKHIIQKLESL